MAAATTAEIRRDFNAKKAQAEKLKERIDGYQDPAEVPDALYSEADTVFAEALELRQKLDQSEAMDKLNSAFAPDPGGFDDFQIAAAAAAGLDLSQWEEVGKPGGDPNHPAQRVRGGQEAGFISAALGDSQLEGPAREWVQELNGGKTRGPNGGILVPWFTPIERVKARLADLTAQRMRAARARYVPDSNGRGGFGQLQASTTGIYPQDRDINRAYAPVFSGQDALDALGIMPTMVGMAEQQYSWNRPPTAAAIAEGGAVTISDLTADEIDLSPVMVTTGTRITQNLAWTRPAAEMELLASMEGAIIEQMAAMILDDATTQGVRGLTVADVTDPGGATAFGAFTALAESVVDGRFAAGPEDIGLVINSETNVYGSGLFVSANSGEFSAINRLRANSGRVVVSEHMPAAATDVSKVLYRRGDSPGAFAFPVWAMVEVYRMQDQRAASYGSGQVLVAAAGFNWMLAPAETGYGNGNDQFRGDFGLLAVHD